MVHSDVISIELHRVFCTWNSMESFSFLFHSKIYRRTNCSYVNRDAKPARRTAVNGRRLNDVIWCSMKPWSKIFWAFSWFGFIHRTKKVFFENKSRFFNSAKDVCWCLLESKDDWIDWWETFETNYWLSTFFVLIFSHFQSTWMRREDWYFEIVNVWIVRERNLDFFRRNQHMNRQYRLQRTQHVFHWKSNSITGIMPNEKNLFVIIEIFPDFIFRWELKTRSMSRIKIDCDCHFYSPTWIRTICLKWFIQRIQ